ncbi:uncharacterized protein LOC134763723 [Penaeus indicus]|uniref:uncharacterized protein LOC134763723 n=1 Tax=Penaeus indicus TaxID=29960 RepID=UPI00300D967C
MAHKELPSQSTLDHLRSVSNCVRSTVKDCVNQYWSELSTSIQQAADTSNIKAMYDGIKKAVGPSLAKTAPLKSKTGEILTDKSMQLERWVEHFSELYSTGRSVHQVAIDCMKHLPEMSELDTPPTLEDLSLAIDRLPVGKAAGKDCIPGEVIRAGISYLLKPLYQLLLKCWEDGEVPQDLRDSNIITLFKNKGDHNDCNNYRGISLLSVVDLTKAFDLVSRDGLFKILPLIGCPPKLLKLIRSFHDGMMSTVQFDGEISRKFGVKSDEGVYLHSRSDGRLFNLACLRAKSKVKRVTIQDLLFTDDAAIVSHSREGLQELMDRFFDACNLFGLTISQKKTQVIALGTDEPPVIFLEGEHLEVVGHFQYLGSTVTDSLSLDIEINKRIGKACSTLSKLTRRVWENKHLSVPVKIQVYRVCVVSTLLYGRESWATYAHQEHKLQVVHMRCLRRILSIRWHDKISNSKVLESAGIQQMQTLLRQKRLRWLGHVHRMDENRIPRALLYSELASGKRNVGRPRLRFVDVCKRDMKACGIDTNNWESHTRDRADWKTVVSDGLSLGENRLREHANSKQTNRNARQHQTTNQPEDAPVFTCGTCGRICKSRIGLFSHHRRCSPTNSTGATP